MPVSGRTGAFLAARPGTRRAFAKSPTRAKFSGFRRKFTPPSDLGAVHADGIVSSDIVGYSTDSLTSGNFNMNAVVFNNIDGSDVVLNEDVTFEGAKGGLDTTDSDTIQVWNPATSGYTTFALDGEENIWYDYDGVIEEPAISGGTPYWYRSRGTIAPRITFKKTW